MRPRDFIQLISWLALGGMSTITPTTVLAQAVPSPVFSEPRLTERYAGPSIWARFRARPEEACVYMAADFIGHRFCFEAREYYAFSRRASVVKAVSLTVPYGFEASFYQDVPGGVLGNVSELLCTYQQRSTDTYASGVRAAKGEIASDLGGGPLGYQNCVGPNQDTRLSDRVSLRKIADISDAQRAAVWANWQTNDNAHCAVNLFLRPKAGAIPDIPRANMALRSRCYGTRSDLSNLTKDIFFVASTGGSYIGDLKTDLGNIEIASPYVQVILHEQRDYGGNSIKLNCGNYRLDTPFIGQIRSIKITTLPTPIASCASALVIKSAWDTP